VAYTRQQLKQDKFAETASDTISWAVQHQKTLATTAVIAGVVVLILAGGWIYYNQRDQQASVELGAALRIYGAPLRSPNAPKPEYTTFTSAKERAESARAAFERVENNYPHTRAAEVSRYFAGVSAFGMGDAASAERILREVADSRNRELSSLGKLALASVYRSENKDADAIKLYQELIARPTDTVPKTTAQLELASLYQQKQPDEANKIYQQIEKEAPTSPASQVAAEHLKGPQAASQPGR
jgi:TolA-binding protein